MKWDLCTVGSLYLLAIVRDENLRCLRDLRGKGDSHVRKRRKMDNAEGGSPTRSSTPPVSHSSARSHIGLLLSIQREAYRIVQEKWNIGPGGLRMFIHYQPSYYHFHVHIVNASYESLGMGMAVGQAHLLDDVISLLELDAQSDGPGIFERLTLTYGLGEQHGLYEPMKAAQRHFE